MISLKPPEKKSLIINFSQAFRDLKAIKDKYKDSKNIFRTCECIQDTIFSKHTRKAKLNNIILDTSSITLLNNIVYNLNNIAHATYLFINFHFIRVLEEGLPITTIDKNFINNSISAISKLDGNWKVKGSE